MRRLSALLWLLWMSALFAVAPMAAAQTFPPLTGRLVDQAKLLNADQARQLSNRLAAIEQQTGHQLVVATLADLQGYDIADYGYRLGRHWKIGREGKDDGVVLIVAPKERKVRIEVGYGLEGQLTDALSSQIIANDIVPRFKRNDYPGGIVAGTEAIAKQIALSPEEARAQAAQAAKAAEQRGKDGNIVSAIFWVVFILIFVLPMFLGRRRGRRYRGGIAPIILWGAGSGGGSSWGSSGGSSWGGGGGGFSGGGGSFGGGGASGGW